MGRVTVGEIEVVSTVWLEGIFIYIVVSPLAVSSSDFLINESLWRRLCCNFIWPSYMYISKDRLINKKVEEPKANALATEIINMAEYIRNLLMLC
jgi:hypothetical protein